MISAFQVKSYLNYWLEAVDSHSLHSPFFFDFYTKVVRGKESQQFSTIEKLRDKLLHNGTPIRVDDHGAGPLSGDRDRTIKAIAEASLTPSRYSKLYERITAYQMARNIIELGTSFGINTLYLAADPKRRVSTFEGAPSIAAVARSTFEFAAATNITIVEGNIDQTLPAFLENQSEKIDLAFVDANHRYEPTIKYFGLLVRKIHFKSVIILDDIHYTPAMEKAWNEIRNHPLVYGSADLYRSGVLFFDPSLNKQHVVLQF